MIVRHILHSKSTLVSPHAIKACGELEVYLHPFLPLALDRASVQIHDPGEECCLLIENEVLWALQPVWTILIWS